jgi:hypothetical protein
MNMKVIDLNTTYNFHKGHMGVFSIILYKRFANFECHSISVNRGYCRLGKFSTSFHSKFEMSIYMKVVSLSKLENFHKGRFLSV